MIYIVANANCVSGGPELLHQFCYHLNKLGVEAEMAYYEKLKFPTQKNDKKLIAAYERYGCKKTEKIIDIPGNTVVLSEGELWFLPRFKHVKLMIWWLSVDNYYKSMRTGYAKIYAPLGMNRRPYNPFLDKYIHCVQSEYAKQFLVDKGIKLEDIYPLSDYLSSEFIAKTNNENKRPKEDVVLYNPQKGIEFTQKIISYCKEIRFIPLIDLTHEEMAELMMKSKVYIDFGNHPGKDRIPREAAVSGCCIITNTEGSAGNETDIKIPVQYKIDMKDKNIPMIISSIKGCIKNYESIRDEFEDYRAEIRMQEAVFLQEVKNIVNLL